MRILYLLSLLLFCLPLPSAAQVLMRFGVEHTQGEATLQGSGYWDIAYNSGLFLTRENRHITFETGIMYSRARLLQYDLDSYQRQLRRRHVYGRINIPIVLHYNLSEKGIFRSVFAGIAPGKAIHMEHTWKGWDSTGTVRINNDVFSESASLREYNADLLAGLSFEFSIGRESALQLCPVVRMSLLSPFTTPDLDKKRLFFAGISLRL